jgi:hypothetical protein
MSQRVAKFLLGGGLGFLVGALMAFPLFFAVPIAGIFEVVNFPAMWLAHIWSDVYSFPPRGEIAWVVVPAAMIVAQWSIVGISVGLFRGLRPHGRGSPNAKHVV